EGDAIAAAHAAGAAGIQVGEVLPLSVLRVRVDDDAVEDDVAHPVVFGGVDPDRADRAGPADADAASGVEPYALDRSPRLDDDLEVLPGGDERREARTARYRDGRFAGREGVGERGRVGSRYLLGCPGGESRLVESASRPQDRVAAEGRIDREGVAHRPAA